jgi:probable HAF family extracellular repeat protein
MKHHLLYAGVAVGLMACSGEPTTTEPNGASAVAVALADYTTVDLGSLGGGSGSASDINNAGQVVGSSSTAEGSEHAFLWRNGVMRDLGTLGGSWSTARAINATGQVVGFSETAAGAVHAFLWEQGAMQDLGTLGGNYSEAWAINDSGKVVGRSDTPAGVSRAFIWDQGGMKRVPGLEKTFALAFGINNVGVVVGYYHSGAGSHAFRVKGGVLTDLGTLGGRSSNATAIRNGMIVGSAQGVGGTHDVLWQGGVITNLGVPGRRNSAEAVNALGQIAGMTYRVTDSLYHGFLWQNGSLRDLGPGAAYGINRSGWIVGDRPVGEVSHATLWKPN